MWINITITISISISNDNTYVRTYFYILRKLNILIKYYWYYSHLILQILVWFCPPNFVVLYLPLKYQSQISMYPSEYQSYILPILYSLSLDLVIPEG